MLILAASFIYKPLIYIGFIKVLGQYPHKSQLAQLKEFA
jgi:hypothetical protein